MDHISVWTSYNKEVETQIYFNKQPFFSVQCKTFLYLVQIQINLWISKIKSEYTHLNISVVVLLHLLKL